jgi:6-phosphofructokinase
MGRHSGFITCYAALANHDADCVLIPEVPVRLDGAGGFLAFVRRRVQRHGHAVIVVAEGAGQDLTVPDGGRDASGNLRLADIGPLLRGRWHGRFVHLPIALATGSRNQVDPAVTCGCRCSRRPASRRASADPLGPAS